MVTMMIDFLSLLLAALLAGSLFGVSLMLNPAGLDAASYIGLQQQAIRTLNNVMPALGAATILVTAAAAVNGRGDYARLWVLVAAVAFFLSAGLITRFLNQPINGIVMTWRRDSAPANWTVLRDEWWRWHVVRLTTTVLGLCLVIGAAIGNGHKKENFYAHNTSKHTKHFRSAFGTRSVSGKVL